MSGRVFALVFILFGIGPAFGADIGIEFIGVMAAGKDVRVALTNKDGGATQWVRVGSSFAGYSVSNYDAVGDALVLTKDGRQFRLPLKLSKVVSGGAKPPSQVERAITNNLRQLGAAADQFYLENGKVSASYDDLVGPNKYVKSMTPVDGENYRTIQFAQGKPLSVTTAGGYTVSHRP